MSYTNHLILAGGLLMAGLLAGCHFNANVSMQTPEDRAIPVSRP